MSSPADTESPPESPAPAAEAGHRRWWLAIIAAIAFALLVVVIMVLSVWFEMLMFPLMPTDAGLSDVVLASQPASLRQI